MNQLLKVALYSLLSHVAQESPAVLGEIAAWINAEIVKIQNKVSTLGSPAAAPGLALPAGTDQAAPETTLAAAAKALTDLSPTVAAPVALKAVAAVRGASDDMGQY